MLRARNAKLPKSLSSLLEFESGSNDPMAVVLTLALIQLLAAPATSWWELLLFFVVQITVGAMFGVAMGEVTRWTLNTLKLENKGIYPVLTVAFALLTYGLAATLHGSGFLAVYLAGLVMRRKAVSHQRNLRQFHDGLAWLMQITMFLILGLQVFPARLVPIAGGGLLVSLFLIFIARPLSVYAALMFSHMSFREKTLVAWVGLRGAVPIVLATFPVLAGLRQADTIFHLVFFIALTSVLLQGPTIPWITQLLRLDRPPADVGPDRRLTTAVSPSS
jgi:potassium/hydrogen antiporter